MADLYTSLYICGVDISVQLKAQSYGMLSTSLNNTKNKMENLIFNKYSGNTGFPLAKWILEFLGIPRIFLGIPRNKGVNFSG